MMSAEHRHHVGPEEMYDLVGGVQFANLLRCGLREYHRVLDIGCGSLRLGRLLIIWLRPSLYCGIEPHRDVLEAGITAEMGQEIVARRTPRFDHNDRFDLGVFGGEFDFLVAHSIFTHAGQQSIVHCTTEGARVLKPGGKFLATYYRGKESYKGQDWVYRACVHYTKRDMLAWWPDEQWSVSLPAWYHPTGQEWIVATRR